MITHPATIAMEQEEHRCVAMYAATQATPKTAEANHRQAATTRQAVQAVTRRQDQAVRSLKVCL